MTLIIDNEYLNFNNIIGLKLGFLRNLVRIIYFPIFYAAAHKLFVFFTIRCSKHFYL